MQGRIAAGMAVLMLGGMLISMGPAAAQQGGAQTHKHDHAHDHGHSEKDAVYKGYFQDTQIRDRSLSDWEGDWQSVHPYLADGTLDPVMAHKAKAGAKTADEYRAYYDIGYRTDVGRITIRGDSVTFHRGGAAGRDEAGTKGRYAYDGRETLTYKKGNRGVRYIFRKVSGDAGAPQFIQFSDHAIAPVKAGHYHLYWGEDRAAVLNELTNWPTYYPATLNGAQIVAEMLAH